MIATVIIGYSSNVTLTITLQFINGLFLPCIQIGINTLIMKNTEASFIGRVNGVLSPMFMGTMVIGMSFSGVIKHATSLSSVYLMSGILFLIGVLVILPLLKMKDDVPLKSELIKKILGNVIFL